jgi:hypothetical protein
MNLSNQGLPQLISDRYSSNQGTWSINLDQSLGGGADSDGDDIEIIEIDKDDSIVTKPPTTIPVYEIDDGEIEIIEVS